MDAHPVDASPDAILEQVPDSDAPNHPSLEVLPAELASNPVAEARELLEQIKADEQQALSSDLPVRSHWLSGRDPVRQVSPGDDDGWAQLVNRLLGIGDATVYGQRAVEIICDLQAVAGYEVTGDVSGLTWALILPDLHEGDNVGLELTILRGLLGLRRAGGWDADVTAALIALGYEGDAVDREVWVYLISGLLAGKGW